MRSNNESANYKENHHHKQYQININKNNIIGKKALINQSNHSYEDESDHNINNEVAQAQQKNRSIFRLFLLILVLILSIVLIILVINWQYIGFGSVHNGVDYHEKISILIEKTVNQCQSQNQYLYITNKYSANAIKNKLEISFVALIVEFFIIIFIIILQIRKIIKTKSNPAYRSNGLRKFCFVLLFVAIDCNVVIFGSFLEDVVEYKKFSSKQSVKNCGITFNVDNFNQLLAITIISGVMLILLLIVFLLLICYLIQSRREFYHIAKNDQYLINQQNQRVGTFQYMKRQAPTNNLNVLSSNRSHLPVASRNQIPKSQSKLPQLIGSLNTNSKFSPNQDEVKQNNLKVDEVSSKIIDTRGVSQPGPVKAVLDDRVTAHKQSQNPSMFKQLKTQDFLYGTEDNNSKLKEQMPQMPKGYKHGKLSDRNKQWPTVQQPSDDQTGTDRRLFPQRPANNLRLLPGTRIADNEINNNQIQLNNEGLMLETIIKKLNSGIYSGQGK